MSLLEILNQRDDQLFQRHSLAGVMVAIVTNNEDPDGMGRVKLKLPWLSDDYESDWARIATLMAGPERGVYFLPEVDDEVLIAFEHGDIRRPMVLGFLWNGVDKPPITNDDGENNIRLIKSRSGHMIRLDDSDGAEKIEIIGKDEKDSIVIDASENAITITADTDINIKAPNGKIVMECSELEISASSSAKITGDSSIDVEASSTLTLKGSTVEIN